MHRLISLKKGLFSVRQTFPIHLTSKTHTNPKQCSFHIWNIQNAKKVNTSNPFSKPKTYTLAEDKTSNENNTSGLNFAVSEAEQLKQERARNREERKKKGQTQKKEQEDNMYSKESFDDILLGKSIKNEPVAEEVETKKHQESTPYHVDDFTGELMSIQEYVEILNMHKAQDIIVFDCKAKCFFTDYIIFCTGQSFRHMKVLSNAILRQLQAKKISNLKPSIEGENDEEWMLVDGGNVIFQVFSPEGRAHYDLDRKWAFQKIEEYERTAMDSFIQDGDTPQESTSRFSILDSMNKLDADYGQIELSDQNPQDLMGSKESPTKNNNIKKKKKKKSVLSKFGMTKQELRQHLKEGAKMARWIKESQQTSDEMEDYQQY